MNTLTRKATQRELSQARGAMREQRLEQWRSQDIVQLLVRDVPPKLKAAIIRCAEKNSDNFMDTAVGALAEVFNVPYTPCLHPAHGSTDPKISTIALRVPRTLRKEVKIAAMKRDTTVAVIVNEALSAAFLTS